MLHSFPTLGLSLYFVVTLRETTIVSSFQTKNSFFQRNHFPHYYTQGTKLTSSRKNEVRMTPLQQKLSEAGVPIHLMSICVDEDLNLLNTKCDEKKDVSVTSKDHSSTTIEIKTLVWEVICDEMESSYIVTATHMNDKVHLSSLRDLIFKHLHLPHAATSPRLKMAPQHIAESLTGFQSGCIPPIGHKTPMKIFIESTLLASTEVSVVSIGAGLLGKSLLLPLDEFLRVADESEAGAIIGPFLQSSRSPSPSTSSVSSTGLHDMTPFEIRQHRKIERYDRRPEPKDRLKEYRKFTTITEKAQLFKTTARKQGRVEDMKALVEEATKTGDFPMLFEVSPEDGMDKNALHVCAWRGDLETVKLLVTTSKKLYPNLDVLNIITKGMGNYGKTPIFFALTQCREEVVRYLVEEGANLLIVNNKGQTPCSIALTHLKEDASNYLFEMETRQLMAGNTFTNYRETHSDRKLYGDLDPRFPVDSENVGHGDLAEQIRKYEESIRFAPADTIYNGYPSQFQPRSLRPTVRWWIRETRSLSAANAAGYCDGEITFTQPRASVPKKTKKTAILTSLSSPRSEALPVPLKVEELPRLMIEEVLEESTTPLLEKLILVNDFDTLALLEGEVDECLNYFSNPDMHMDKSYDDILLNSTWGIDCEWKPGVAFGIHNPVSTLQLSTRRKTFLVDLQSICQDSPTGPCEQENLEARLDPILIKLFKSPTLPLLGYGILQDISKLAASFPHMKCFLDYTSVIDLQSVSSIVYSKASRENMSSLQKITAKLLKKQLDKSQQCSDWTQRPLSQDQIDYAMLDAAVLPQLLNTMVKQSTVVGGYNGQFFKIHSCLQSSIRYTKVDPAKENFVYDVSMGSIKTILGKEFARQCWASPHEAPAPPKLIPAQDILETSGPTRKERVHLRKVGDKVGSKRPKPVELKTLAGNLENLPIPGITLGYTKESCVFRVVGHRLLNTFPDGTYIGFNRRAGVVETTNAWIVFCNFGTRSAIEPNMYRESYSDFYDGGRHLSFRLNPNAKSGCSSEASLYRHLMSRIEQEKDNGKKIILFARGGTKSKYLYCGLCECIKATPLDSGSTSVLFNLLQFDELMGKSRISSDFEELVASRLNILNAVQ